MECATISDPCSPERVSDTTYVSTPYIYNELGSSASNLGQRTSDSDSSIGLIVGAAVGGVVLVGAIITGVFYLKKRAKKRSDHQVVTVTRAPDVQMTNSGVTYQTDKI